MNTPSNIETLVLGGGCFWCTEAVFVQVKGVLDVESGYCNGHTLNPTYEQVCSGNTGHNEVVRLQYDPSVISARVLLEIFFGVHDATTLNQREHVERDSEALRRGAHRDEQLLERLARTRCIRDRGHDRQRYLPGTDNLHVDGGLVRHRRPGCSVASNPDGDCHPDAVPDRDVGLRPAPGCLQRHPQAHRLLPRLGHLRPQLPGV